VILKQLHPSPSRATGLDRLIAHSASPHGPLTARGTGLIVKKRTNGTGDFVHRIHFPKGNPSQTSFRPFRAFNISSGRSNRLLKTFSSSSKTCPHNARNNIIRGRIRYFVKNNLKRIIFLSFILSIVIITNETQTLCVMVGTVGERASCLF